MENLAKTLLWIGLSFIILSAVVFFLTKMTGGSGLPGDIVIKRERFTFYFPLATCLLVSLILTFVFQLWNRR